MRVWKALSAHLTRMASHSNAGQEEREFKEIVLPAILFASLVSGAAVGGNLAVGEYKALVFTASVLTVSTACLVSALLFRTLSHRMVSASLLVTLLGVFWYDLYTFGAHDGWLLSLPPITLSISSRLHRTSQGMAFLTSLFLTFKSVSEAVWVGWYDVLGGYPGETKGVSVGVLLLLSRNGVLFLIFHLLSSHRAALDKEQLRMKESISLAEDVAHALSSFDLTEATGLVEKDSSTRSSPGLRKAFVHILEGLQGFRPFLPDGVFESDEVEYLSASPPDTEVAPPTGFAAIVFTDIEEGSGENPWTNCPDAMKKAIDLHNEVIHKCCHMSNGYEVKTIGNAFMIAFECVADACRFSLTFQEALLYEKWPEELLQLEDCEPVYGRHGDLLWRGIRVKVGIHCGEVDMHVNPITGRADYSGATVTIAARIESCAAGGCILVTDDVLHRLDGNRFYQMCDPVVRNLGLLELKGITVARSVNVMLPRHLSDRIKVVGSLPRTSDIDMSVQSAGGSPRHTQTKLYFSPATVATVRFSFDHLKNLPSPEYSVNELISGVLDAAEKTDGSVLCICNTSCVVIWNAMGKRTAMHASMVTRFSSLLFSAGEKLYCNNSWNSRIHVGAATGGVLCGVVGNSRRRFVIALGSCCELSSVFAQDAERLNVFTILGALPGYKCAASEPTLKTLTRPVVWYTTEKDEHIVGYELATHSLASCNGVWGIVESSVTDIWNEDKKFSRPSLANPLSDFSESDDPDRGSEDFRPGKARAVSLGYHPTPHPFFPSPRSSCDGSYSASLRATTQPRTQDSYS
eukprot:Sspe_Gene.117582::Locus_109100_Transcript_1_1_Confidence_1.000_Length_2560::g.117582::m.117582